MAANNNWNNSNTGASATTYTGATINISNDAVAATVNVANGAAAKTLTMGSTNSSSSLALKCGTSDFSLASATGTVMSALDTGEITRGLQPAFLAYASANVNDVTGDGTTYTLGTTALTEVFDQNGDFNTNGTFTAPVTGRYFFIARNTLSTPGGGGTNAYIQLNTSNRNVFGTTLPTRNRVTNFFGTNAYLGYEINILVDMDAGDTATVTITSSGGAKTDDIIGGNTVSLFSGYLAV